MTVGGGKSISVQDANGSFLKIQNLSSGQNYPFELKVPGDLRITSLNNPGAPGTNGTVYADKYCFNNNTCIAGSWGSGGGAGSYVLKAGDTMTGMLTVNAPNALQSIYGLSSLGTGVLGYSDSAEGGAFYGNTAGVTGYADGASGVGGKFQGTATGVEVSMVNPASGVGVWSKNGSIAGQFDGGTYGVKASGATAAVSANGKAMGVQAQSTNANSIAVSGVAPMTGTGGSFSGGLFAVDAVVAAPPGMTGPGTAVRGTNGDIGGDFSGDSYGIKAKTKFPGSGVAVSAQGGTIAGEFTGTNYGVTGSATAGGGVGGKFTSTSGVGLQAYSYAPGTTAAYFIGASGGLYASSTAAAGNGIIGYGASYGVYGRSGSTGGSGGYFSDQNQVNRATIGGPTYSVDAVTAVKVGTNLEAPNNVWGSTVAPTSFSLKYGGVWTNVVGNDQCGTRATAPNLVYSCPNGTFMSGIRMGATQQVTEVTCCML